MYFRQHVEGDLKLDSVGATQTRFLHGRGRLQFIEQHVFPEWEAEVASGSRARHIRIWCAGSAPGDGAYSLALTLLERFPVTSGWRIEILSTGLSRVADDAVEKSKGTDSPDEIAKDESEIGPVEFHRINLDHKTYPLGGPFDLIFCCNVLLYVNYQPSKGVPGRSRARVSVSRGRSKTR